MSISESPSSPGEGAGTLVEVVVPAHNEERTLERSVRRLHRYLSGDFPYDWRIVVADSASDDATWNVAQGLADVLPRTRAVHVGAQGRGRALRAAWSSSDADILAYMDADLSTGLRALPVLVAPLVGGHSDLSIGSRLAPGARVTRGLKRELISRWYNILVRIIFHSSIRDAQCGFKAARRDVLQALLPAVKNERWFFDTELLVLAQYNGLRIHELPVEWVEDLDSRVKLLPTVLENLWCMQRLSCRLRTGRGNVPALAGLPDRSPWIPACSWPGQVGPRPAPTTEPS